MSEITTGEVNIAAPDLHCPNCGKLLNNMVCEAMSASYREVALGLPHQMPGGTVQQVAMVLHRIADMLQAAAQKPTGEHMHG